MNFNFAPDEILLRDAEYWADCADIGTLDDAELLRRAKLLMPRLKERLDDYVAFCRQESLVHIIGGKRGEDF